ncbi:MAG: transcription antiterminator [Lachnospiraceae bacterium]|nr:transcription antiterminator [Lachnospiraceae bacterium]
MWYVVQVRTDSEESICQQCGVKIPESVLHKSFIPCYEERRRFRGEWITEKRRLFPGYVFLDTENIPDTFHYLREVIGLTKLLGVGDDIVPLTEAETRFMKQLGGEEQVVGLSELLFETSQVRVLSGPLKGKEGLIKKNRQTPEKSVSGAGNVWKAAESRGRV